MAGIDLMKKELEREDHKKRIQEKYQDFFNYLDIDPDDFDLKEWTIDFDDTST